MSISKVFLQIFTCATTYRSTAPLNVFFSFLFLWLLKTECDCTVMKDINAGVNIDKIRMFFKLPLYVLKMAQPNIYCFKSS